MNIHEAPTQLQSQTMTTSNLAPGICVTNTIPVISRELRIPQRCSVTFSNAFTRIFSQNAEQFHLSHLLSVNYLQFIRL